MFTGQLTVEKYARMVPVDQIETNEFNLNIPRYIDSQEPEDAQDIAAHLLGGIPNANIDALHGYWDVCPSLKAALFTDGLRPGYSSLNPAHDQIKPTIHDHPEFVAYRQTIQTTFADWQTTHTPTLKSLTVGSTPKTLIAALGDALLRTFAGAKLLDTYDVYQHLMSYWLDTMQDDVYLLSVDGWVAKPAFVPKKDGKLSGEWECDLLPKRYVIDRYLAAERRAAEQLDAAADAFTRQVEELEEEHGGEDGLFAQADVLNEKGTVDKKKLTVRLKALKKANQTHLFPDEAAKAEAAQELATLQTYQTLTEQADEAAKKARVAHADLDRKAFEQYGKLTEDEIKTLVVDDKWLTALRQALTTELERTSQRLSGRVGELADRYNAPLPQLMTTVDDLTTRVDAHLLNMGFVW